MLFRSNRERILFIVLAIVWVISPLNISNALAETIYSNDGSGVSCDCIVEVEEGTGDWDHWECDMYDPWQYVGQGGNWTCDESQVGSGNCMMPHYCDGTTEPPTLPGNCWFDNYYDVRSYDASFPRYDLVNNPGGWTVGMACQGEIPEIDRVEIQFGPTIEGMVHKNVIDTPASYMWGESMIHDWTVRYGSRYFFEGGPVTVTVYFPVGSVSETITPMINQAKPPVCEIKKRSILKSGELKIRFTAPYDLRDNHIRVRVFAEGPIAVMEYQHKIFPPYQRKSKPDELEVLIPAEHAGKRARIEYRVQDDGYMSRSVTYFKLPELE